MLDLTWINPGHIKVNNPSNYVSFQRSCHLYIHAILSKVKDHQLNYTACQNYMQIDIFVLTLKVFNEN